MLPRIPHIVVTDFEADLPTPYTASTLAFLKTRSPLVRFVWIMGADNLATFDRWQRWREIFTMVPVVVVDRPGWRLKALASKAARALRRRPGAGNGSRRPCPQAGAGLDVPDRSPVARVLDGDPQQGASAATRPWLKSHNHPRACLEKANPSRPGTRRPTIRAAKSVHAWHRVLKGSWGERLSSAVRISLPRGSHESERGRAA